MFHVSSCIWCGFKPFLGTIHDNSIWQIGDGTHIWFWSDKWFSSHIVELLNIPNHLHSSLRARVMSDFMHQGVWHFPDFFQQLYPQLVVEIQNVALPLAHREDHNIVWCPSVSGTLSFKLTYDFMGPRQSPVVWSKLLWHPAIPPSRSFLFWRFLHDKVPTDDKLKKTGMLITSRCGHCGACEETTNHLFLSCPFAQQLWLRVFGIFLRLEISLITSISQSMSKQAKDMMFSVIINLIWYLWCSWNHGRFQTNSWNFLHIRDLACFFCCCIGR